MPRPAIPVLLVALALVAAPVPSVAAPVLTVDPSTVDPGDQATVKGAGFEADTNIQLYLDTIERRTFLGTTHVGNRGTFSRLVTIPGDTAPGEHTVIACERQPSGVCRVRATKKITVRAPASTPSPTSSPTHSPTASASPTASPTATATAGVTSSPGVISSPSPTTPGPKLGAEFPDLSVTGIEVTQGVQNLANNMPLLPLRPTFARAYIHSAGGAWKDVRGILGAVDGGQLLGTVSPINQPLEAKAGLHRKDHFSSLIFRIPAGWTTRGTIQFIAFAYPGTIDAAFDEPDTENNFKDVTVTFGSKAILYRAVLVPVHIHKEYTPESDDVSWLPTVYPESTAKIISGAERLLPVSMILPLLIPWEMYPPGHSGGSEFRLHETSLRRDPAREKVFAQLQSWKEQSGPLFGSYQWYGMLPETGTTWEWNQTLKKGINFTGQSNGEVSMGKMSPFGGDVAFEYGTSGTLAHEWAHDLGLAHYGCVASSDPDIETIEQAGGGLDPNFPTGYPNCSYAVVDPAGYYGFDVYYDRFPEKYAFYTKQQPSIIGNNPAFKKGERGMPLMSYGEDKWLDPYSACKMLNTLDVTCTAYPPQSPGPGGPTGLQGFGLGDVRLVAAQAAAETLMVSGSASSNGTAGELFDVAVLDDVSPDVRAASLKRLSSAPASAPLALVLSDGAGTELARYRVAPRGVPQHEGPEDDFGFVEWVPVPDGLRRVSLMGGGRTLASVAASAGAPSLQILSPADDTLLSGSFKISWRGSDPDGDALSYDVLTSDNGGRTWRVVSSGLGATSLELGVAQLPGGNRTRFRVRGSDGFHTATDETGDLRVPNSPPNLVLIMSPPDGATYRKSDLVVLNGRAIDLTDELVENLTWSSDRDGRLGAGADLGLRSLSPGKHVITLRATDRDGASSEQRVTITLDGSRSADVPDDATVARVRALFVARIEPESANVTWFWIPVAAGGVIVLAAAGLWMRAHRRRQHPDAGAA